MVTGIALVTVERKMLRQATEALLQIPGVTEVYTVAGEYDLVVMIRVSTNAELSDVVANKMTRDIPGISHHSLIQCVSPLWVIYRVVRLLCACSFLVAQRQFSG